MLPNPVSFAPFFGRSRMRYSMTASFSSAGNETTFCIALVYTGASATSGADTSAMARASGFTTAPFGLWVSAVMTSQTCRSLL